MMDVFIREFPQQLLAALEHGKTLRYTQPKQPIHNIVVIGMGGSGIGADFVEEFTRNERKVPMLVCKGYELPAYVGENSLVIVSSYSGNTEETLIAMDAAMARGCHIVCIASGGEVIRRAQANGYDHVVVPNFGAPPRACLGYSLVHQLCLLSHLRFISADRLREVERAAYLLREHQERMEVQAQYMSKLFVGRFPVLYASERMTAVAVRWRQQLNENSKILCSHHVIPEMNHNELVGWRKQPNEFVVVMLRSKKDHPRNQVRTDINREVISAVTNTIVETYAVGDSLIEEMLYLAHIGDWLSLEVAKLRQVDAVEVEVINYLKGELAKI